MTTKQNGRKRRDHADMAAAGYLTETAAAVFLGRSRTTLAKWRAKGTGPKVKKFHARLIGYLKADLVSFKATLAVA